MKRLVILVLALLSSQAQAQMFMSVVPATSSGSIVAYDNANLTDYSATAPTITLTVGASANRYAAIFIGGEGASEWHVDSVKDDEGHKFELIKRFTSYVGTRCAELWGYAGVSTGSRTFTVYNNMSVSGNMGAISFSNVHQTTSHGTGVASETGYPADDNVTLGQYDMGLSGVFVWGDAPGFTAGDTERWHDPAGDSRTGGQTQVGTGTVTLDWTITDNAFDYIHIAVAIYTASP